MAKASNLFPLKLLVISLGCILVGGMVFVLTTVLHKTNSLNKPACGDVKVSLEKMQINGIVTALVPQKDTIMVTVMNDTESKLLTLDACTGAVLQQFTVTP